MRRGKQEVKEFERTKLVVPLEEAQSRVQLQLERGTTVPNESVNENDEARRWYDFTAELLRQLCTTDELRDEFTGKSSFSFGGGDITTGSYLKKLRSIYERLELLPVSTVPSERARHKHVRGRRIFVVHGHDDGAKEAVARYLAKLDLEPVVLHEQPNRGRTIIENSKRTRTLPLQWFYSHRMMWDIRQAR